MNLNIYVPRNKEDSKCWHVFSPFMQGWKGGDTHIEHDYEYQGGMGMFWGLVGQNHQMIKTYDAKHGSWLFSDMPYFGRWNPHRPDDECYWRICKNSVHQRDIFRNDPPDRFDKFGISIAKKRVKGDEIILCPSSNNMHILVGNMTQRDWILSTIETIQKITDRPIRVRHKPRKNGTSGPHVADIPFAEDIKNAYCVVASASMASVEAIINGVPVVTTSNHNPVTSLGISCIEAVDWYPDEAKNICNTLAYSQFTSKEMYSGFAYEMCGIR